MNETETSAVDALGEALEPTTLNFNELIDQFLTNLSIENILLQLAVVVVSILIGLYISRRINAKLERWTAADGAEPHVNLGADPGTMVKGGFDRREVAEAVGTRLRRVTAGFLRNISFSLSGGLILALGAWMMVQVFGFPHNSLILCRIAYSILLAYALLCCILSVAGFMIGGKGISKSSRRVITVIFWVLVALEIFGVLDDIIGVMESTKVPLGGGTMTVWTCFVAICTILITVGVANWAANLVETLIKSATSLSPNLQVAITRVIRILLFLFAVMTGLSSVGIDLTVLSVFGGAVGVGLGFGLQKIASNYISGFIILLERSIKIGDLVEVANFRGRITQINTRFTVVRNNDGVECVVPNENFVTSPVKNHSYTEEACVQYVEISVAYGANVKRALEIMLEEGMRERPRIVKGRRGWAYLDSFGDSGINLKLGFWVKDPVNGVAGLKTQVATAILERFNAEGIEVPYNRLEINLREVQAGAVRVKLEKDAAEEAKAPEAAPAQ